MLIEIHILQNYAPANLNRDDTGAPKDAFFGGIRRGRISSQCLKRSIRRSDVFAEAFNDENLLGMRTVLLPRLIEDALAALGVDPETSKAIVARVPEIGRESKKRTAGEETEEGGETDLTKKEAEAEAETKQLIFIGLDEVPRMAAKLLEQYRKVGNAKNWAKIKIPDITKELGPSVPRSVDIAMFGRMTTSEAFEDVKAAVQVAHALSTCALAQEFDYYTAVDDLSGKSSAEFIGDVEFNSLTYYKYLNVHWEQLVTNLGGDVAVARRAALALLEAAATAQPTGKQNSFASHCLPDLVLVEARDRNLPVSYANAFLRPARASGDRTLMDASVDQLSDYLTRVCATYGLSDRRAFTAIQDYALPGASRATSLSLLKEWLAGQLPEA
jgi:CRISPR system Cascade subunit CasC